MSTTKLLSEAKMNKLITAYVHLQLIYTDWQKNNCWQIQLLIHENSLKTQNGHTSEWLLHQTVVHLINLDECGVGEKLVQSEEKLLSQYHFFFSEKNIPHSCPTHTSRTELRLCVHLPVLLPQTATCRETWENKWRWKQRDGRFHCVTHPSPLTIHH